MKLAEFDYNLPKKLVAQYPSETRGEDRLLILDRAKNSFEEKNFLDITDFFKKGDLLVLNNTKVIPARLFGKRKTGGRVEIFIVDTTKAPAEALVRPSGRIKEEETVILESGDEAKVLGRAEVGRFVEFKKPIDEILKECGHIPLPPYISRTDEPSDRLRYQTIYADQPGATASPTAGLHFTEDIISKLKQKGVEIAYITLHVSYGTFAPIKEENAEEHRMHSEFYRVPTESITMVNKAKRDKRRIFACGTTTLRALETCASNPSDNTLKEGFTNLYIYPGYEFKVVSALITNFHLPKSTLLLLTSAFCNKELLFKAYEYAVEKKFRFFSYGDAMLIV